MVQIGGISCQKWLTCAAVLCTTACASTAPALKKQLDEVNRKLLTAENDNARLELRVAGLETRVDHLSNRPQSADAGSSQPALKVVRLAPEAPSAGTEGPPGGASAGPMADSTGANSAEPPVTPTSPVTSSVSGEMGAGHAEPDDARPLIQIDGDQVLQAGGEETRRPPPAAPRARGKKNAKRGGA